MTKYMNNKIRTQRTGPWARPLGSYLIVHIQYCSDSTFISKVRAKPILQSDCGQYDNAGTLRVKLYFLRFKIRNASLSSPPGY